MLYTLHFLFSKCSFFHNANFFGSCIIHILYTGCAKIKKNNSGAKGLNTAGLLVPEFLDISRRRIAGKFTSLRDIISQKKRVASNTGVRN